MSIILQVISHSEEETIGLAEKIISFMKPGDLIILTGQLGAGKTAFVKGLAHGLGHDMDNVNSPTYTIVNEYQGEKPLYHFDLYRLGDTSELFEIGWDDFLSRDALVVVEWGERAEDYLPKNYYEVKFDIIGDNEREITISVIDDE